MTCPFVSLCMCVCVFGNECALMHVLFSLMLMCFKVCTVWIPGLAFLFDFVTVVLPRCPSLGTQSRLKLECSVYSGTLYMFLLEVIEIGLRTFGQQNVHQRQLLHWGHEKVHVYQWNEMFCVVVLDTHQCIPRCEALMAVETGSALLHFVHQHWEGWEVLRSGSLFVLLG